MKRWVILVIFVPGIFLVANGTMTPIEYQNETLPHVVKILDDEVKDDIFERFFNWFVGDYETHNP